jgi:hypothetical protein
MGTLSSVRSGDAVSYSIVKVATERDSDRALALIPFDFMVGERRLRSGHYALEPRGVRGMVIVRRADSRCEPVIVQAIRTNLSAQEMPDSLLFYQQEDFYFLAQALLSAS